MLVELGWYMIFTVGQASARSHLSPALYVAEPDCRFGRTRKVWCSLDARVDESVKVPVCCRLAEKLER